MIVGRIVHKAAKGKQKKGGWCTVPSSSEEVEAGLPTVWIIWVDQASPLKPQVSSLDV